MPRRRAAAPGGVAAGSDSGLFCDAIDPAMVTWMKRLAVALLIVTLLIPIIYAVRLSSDTGRADDVVGTAEGQTAGNAFRWAYTLALPVDGRVWHVQFDDWMYLMDQRTMLNKAEMSKFGIRLGEVTLSFVKRTP